MAGAVEFANLASAVNALPGPSYSNQGFPRHLTVGTFGGYFGFFRAGRPPLPDLPLSFGPFSGPYFAHFEKRRAEAPPWRVSKLAALFTTSAAAADALVLLRDQERSVLTESVSDLSDLSALSIGDEYGWGWRMIEATGQTPARTEYGWRRGRALLHLLFRAAEGVEQEPSSLASSFDAIVAGVA